MSLTLDFILLFILIIIPGLIFKRFYFFGEFSKQFNTRDTVYQVIFYSIIPGIIIQAICIVIYILCFDHSFKNDEVLEVFQGLIPNTSKNDAKSDKVSVFLNEDIGRFILFEVCVMLSAIVSGSLLSNLIRLFRWDIRFKILRFRNSWYYVFSGQINSFKKFKNTRAYVDPLSTNPKKLKYYPPYIDILINTGQGLSLYSGYLIDYDLNYDNTSKLEKIYLMHAHRYTQLSDDPAKAAAEREKYEVHGSKIKKPIPGDTFILNCNNLVNINIAHIPIPQNKEKQQTRKKKRLTYISSGVLTFNFLIFLYFTLINTSIFSDISPLLSEHFKDFNFFSRLFSALIVVQFTSIFSPSRKIVNQESTKSSSQQKEKIPKTKTELSYSRGNIFAEIVFLFVLVIIYYLIYY